MRVKAVNQSGQVLYVTISGTPAALSGLWIYQATSTLSGQNVVVASGLYVTATMSWASTNVVSIGSGIAVQMSGAFFSLFMSGMATALLVSGTVTSMSGMGVTANLVSGTTVYFLSGNVTTQMDSGLALYVQMSTTAYPGLSGAGFVIGGMNRALLSGVATAIASGQFAFATLDTDGALFVDIDKTDSSGLYINLPSAAAQSGKVVIVNPPTTTSAGIFLVGAVGVKTQFPASPGRKHRIQMMTSSVLWVAGVNTVASGVGFAMMGIPGTDIRTFMDVELSNLNLLYGNHQGAAASGGQVSFISFNW
jgi:hypothetical protein